MQPQILTAADSTTPEISFLNVSREVKELIGSQIFPEPWEGISE